MQVWESVMHMKVPSRYFSIYPSLTIKTIPVFIIPCL